MDIIEDFFKIFSSNDETTMEDEEQSFIRLDIMSKIIATVEELITVLNKLETYRFYTASLLVTYDGDCNGLHHRGSSGTALPKYDIRMIDFAHSTHRGLRDQVVHEGPDLGFIQGLRSLVQIIEQLMQKHQQD